MAAEKLTDGRISDQNDSGGPFGEVVFSSEVRLFRNIPSLPFSRMFTGNDVEYLKLTADKFMKKFNTDGTLELIDLSAADIRARRLLREKGHISSEMEKRNHSLVIIHKGGAFSIHVNDTDHFVIRSARPGLAISETFKAADEADDMLNSITPYSFDEQLGYLSPSVNNIGTGMRASALLHLPALCISGGINRVIEEFKGDDEIILSGVTDTAGKNWGSAYSLCNKRTLGLSEIDIADMADAAVNRIVSAEDDERDNLYADSRIDLEDRIMRSFGILTHSKTLSYGEAVSMLSNIRLGVVLSIIRGISLRQVDAFMRGIQPCHLENYFEKKIGVSSEQNICRSQYLKEGLK